MSKKSEAKKEMLKMLIDNDGYMKVLKKGKKKSQARVDQDNMKHVSSGKKANNEAFIHELNEVGPDLKKGIKREFKKIKDMFKKDKKD
jgi:ASC-1-like (ASCH) protein